MGRHASGAVRRPATGGGHAGGRYGVLLNGRCARRGNRCGRKGGVILRRGGDDHGRRWRPCRVVWIRLKLHRA